MPRESGTMIDKPTIAVVGSCVSRDVFNSRFIEGYKNLVNVGETIYQSALPSLVRSKNVDYEEPQGIQEQFRSNIEAEYTGANFDRLVTSRPDFVLFDLFSDVHFGVTRKLGGYVTRNHMAFNSLRDADRFYDDASANSLDRMRFEARTSIAHTYEAAAAHALGVVAKTIKQELPDTKVILNSARFATAHTNQDGSVADFSNAERLAEKNKNWDAADKLFLSDIDAQQITHPSKNFVGSFDHPWGLHPVHYTQPYYDELWRQIKEIVVN